MPDDVPFGGVDWPMPGSIPPSQANRYSGIQNVLKSIQGLKPSLAQNLFGVDLEGKLMDYIFPSKQPLVQPQTVKNVITGLTSGGVETPGSNTDTAQSYLADTLSEMTKGPNMAYMAAGLMGGAGARPPVPSKLPPESFREAGALANRELAGVTPEEIRTLQALQNITDPMGVLNTRALGTEAQVMQGEKLLRDWEKTGQMEQMEAATAAPENQAIADRVRERMRAKLKAKQAEGFGQPTPLSALPKQPVPRPDPPIPEAQFPPLPNGKMITIRRADGTTYRAAMDTERSWPKELTDQLGISSGAPIHRVTIDKDGPQWSTGMLDPGETIVPD